MEWKISQKNFEEKKQFFFLIIFQRKGLIKIYQMSWQKRKLDRCAWKSNKTGSREHFGKPCLRKKERKTCRLFSPKMAFKMINKKKKICLFRVFVRSRTIWETWDKTLRIIIWRWTCKIPIFWIIFRFKFIP